MQELVRAAARLALKTLSLSIVTLCGVLPSFVLAQTATEGILTTGPAPERSLCSATATCSSRTRFYPGYCGVVTDDTGRDWPVPTEVNTGRTCTDIWDECNGGGIVQNPAPETIVVGQGGPEITGYIQGDNYSEFYVNGEFICRDSVPFVPFNSSIVAFEAEYPITYAIRATDWEEHLGIGMEYARYGVGDAGLVAAFSDGTRTGGEWRCQVFYVAPVDDASCVVEFEDGRRETSACPVRPSCASRDPETCSALHYEVPDNWASPDFDDSGWPLAKVFSERDVRPGRSYNSIRELFAGAQFIWTDDLNLDNEVLCRITVEGPSN